MLTFLVLQTLVLAVSCDLFASQLGYQTEYAPTYDNYKPRDYQFNYGVSDPHTGDHKSQWEVKQDGVVRGAYSLLEPDGTTRVVEYIADDDGFRAVVKKLGTSIHPEPIAPVVSELSQYHSYSGGVDNYAAVPILSQPQAIGYDSANVQQLGVPIGSSYQTLINYGTPHQQNEVVPNYIAAPQSYAVPSQPEVISNYQVPQSYAVPSQPEVVPNAEYLSPASNLLPIGPSYTTNIQYDGYNAAAAYSQKIHNVVPAPITKRTVNLKNDQPSGKFLIYVPESD